MALTVGFIVVFLAGVAGAYFAGRQAARHSLPSVPTRSPAAMLSDDKSESPGGDAADAVSATQVATADAQDIDLSADRVTVADEDSTEGGIFDTRKFKRLEFSGTAEATIYPPQREAGREPIRCEVLTRDLSCGGIGIAHTERLVPQQMVVLDAVGKLLVSEVRWCRRIEKDFYLAGCRLIKTTT